MKLSTFVTKFSPRTTPTKPKFIDGQKVEFKITLTATAVIDGVPEWDDEEQKHLYAVKNIVVSEECEEDFSLDDCQVTVDEPGLLWEDEILTDKLPSCEFDPD